MIRVLLASVFVSSKVVFLPHNTLTYTHIDTTVHAGHCTAAYCLDMLFCLHRKKLQIRGKKKWNEMSPSIKSNVDVIEGEPGDLTNDPVPSMGPPGSEL